jgi:hypothetical protein
MRTATVAKLLTILSACIVVAGGGAYALYSFRSHECSRCQQAQMSCCFQSIDPNVSVSDEMSPMMAVAGPAALFGTTPVKADLGGSCSAAKAQAYNCCDLGSTGEHGLEAVTGSAATLARK